MKDLDINFPLDKFEKLIVDIGWESLDDWFNFWNNQRNIFSIDEYWKNKVNDDWIWGWLYLFYLRLINLKVIFLIEK